MSIPVICDRCRSTGISGEADFSHLGDLLDFTPVPRKKQRVDGWSPEKQRAFIAALSATGSKRQAALAIGMQPYGIDQMLKGEGSDSFKAAYERAMAIASQHGSMKVAQGVADAAARSAVIAHSRASTALTPPSRLRGYEPEPEAEISDERKWELIENIGAKFLRKVAAEREARLAGEIVAADFYLRQVTMLEVVFDLTAGHFGWDAQDVLRQLRRDGRPVWEIASTPFSDLLDASRRVWWAEEGEPERPPHPDARFLQRHSSSEGDYCTAPSQSAYGATTIPARGYSQEEWARMPVEEQMGAREKQNQEDAVAQAEWERRAHDDWHARQNPLSLDGRGQGEGES